VKAYQEGQLEEAPATHPSSAEENEQLKKLLGEKI